MALSKKQLAARLAALNEKVTQDVAAAQAEIDATNATIAAANQPVIEEMPEYLVGMPYRIPTPSIETINQSIANDTFIPGVLKEGIQVGPLPENVLKALNVKSLEAMNPNAVGWRIVTDANGTQRLEVQESDGSITGYGAPVGGAAVPGANNASSSAASNVTLVSTTTDKYGNVIGIFSDGSTKTLIQSGNKYASSVDMDAYALLEQTFKDYGLETLVDTIKGYMDRGLGAEQAALELRKSDAYIKRFRGNEIRRSAGLNVLSEAAYLSLENSYTETLRAYGLQGYFGLNRDVSQSKMADIIGNDISAVEFKDRIDTVVTRVNNADPMIKATLKSFYNITDTDLVGYFLNPKENLPKLQEKVTAAEIGSEALKQNLVTGVDSATALAQLGITKTQAREGYSAIGAVLPTTTKLGQIYGEEGIQYSQTLAEQEVFGQLESAKRKRMKLAEKEIGTFSGASGLGRGALTSGNSGSF